MIDENALRQEICDVGRLLYGRGYTVGSAGNISARLDDGWLITPTDACLGRMDPADIAKVNLAGEWVSGSKPSKTLALHREVYDRNPQVGGVVHTHSTHLVALTLAGVWQEDDILPPLTPYQVMKVGHIPLIPYERPGSPKVAERVAELANSVRGVMLEPPRSGGLGKLGGQGLLCPGRAGRDCPPVADEQPQTCTAGPGGT